MSAGVIGRIFRRLFESTTRRGLLIATMLTCFPYAAFVFQTTIGNKPQIDKALYEMEAVVGKIEVFEHDEPADVVYDFCTQEKQARLRTVRY